MQKEIQKYIKHKIQKEIQKYMKYIKCEKKYIKRPNCSVFYKIWQTEQFFEFLFFQLY